ncbi:MAG: peptide-methionine (R)-S-oxide reductase MsrB [Gammaproteobacteria bacterium]|nr:peptide-methionine (R)-S-oxide reductase MsrB [Gammaproteobacteria bacterium]MBU1625337.1 peptide-methionine (R)-S-oxide reductase MsrB [Gammaproteobacteria bacterium]MBU1981597.1 peptide-methionine (R)-S-oxide reductase MsrB [Gammaproteobacteria bacterium]
MDRRTFISFAASGAGLMLLPAFGRNVFAAEGGSKLILSDAEWKQKLTPQQYDILRREGTERAFTSALDKEKRKGMFHCAGCDQALFPSRFKFDSGTGWPSFYDVLPGAVETSTDYKLIYPRTEYHCSRCGGHHGHVFKDGPQPTGLRYCNNGAVLKFVPEKA